MRLDKLLLPLKWGLKFRKGDYVKPSGYHPGVIQSLCWTNEHGYDGDLFRGYLIRLDNGSMLFTGEEHLKFHRSIEDYNEYNMIWNFQM